MMFLLYLSSVFLVVTTHISGAVCDRNERFLEDSASWSTWSPWTACSATCEGFAFRVRHCELTGSCVGAILQNKTCNPCSIDGDWGSWDSWSSCSQSCGPGLIVRLRRCDNPSPYHGGAMCSGDANQFQICDLRDCPVKSSWLEWKEWSSCTATCGNGTRLRVRQCTQGVTCTGSSVEQDSCMDKMCPIDGGWTSWLPSACSVTCGTGFVRSTRLCINPKPKYGGKPCDGSNALIETCTKPPCEVDCPPGDWSAWSGCPVVCGEGYRSRNRTCSPPSADVVCRNCTGLLTSRETCNKGACPADIKTCDKIGTLTAIQQNTSVHQTVGKCADSNFDSSDALMKALCGAPTDNSSWKLGVHVLDTCERVPLYAAVGYQNSNTSSVTYGILIDCLEDGFKIATQSCSTNLASVVEQHNPEATEFRLLLW